MKPFIYVLMLLAGISASADSFTIIRDGKEYMCELRNPLPIDPVDCINRAYSGPFSRDEAQQLCVGARSAAPAECGIRAYSGPFSKSESIQLCVQARTVGPAECGIRAYNGPFSKEESVTLCKGNGSLANADCAIRAYNGPYSREEAVRMCKEQPHLVLRSLALLEQSQDLKPNIEAIKNKLNSTPAIK